MQPFIKASLYFAILFPVSALAEPSANISSTPTDTANTNISPKVMSKADSIEYLKSHPDELEKILSGFILRQDAENLKDLIPVYAQYPQRDDSVIDWGNAIIVQKQGRINDAIHLYRKVNAVLPNVKPLRFQLAYALYQDKQFKAAKSELEKLRSSLTKQADIDQINQYIRAIDSQNRWTYDFNLNFLNDSNLTNAAPVGTTIDNGTYVFKQEQPHEEGKGIGYYLGANRKWLIDDRYYTSVHLNLNGKNYWDNKKFNEAYGTVGAGLGYQNAITEVELYPSFTQGWFGDSLHRYLETKALNLAYSHWFNPKFLYQNFTQYGTTRYESPLESNNVNNTVFSNTLTYLPKQTRSFNIGLDYLDSENTEGYDGDSYKRKGLRLGWGEAWNHGISTRVSLGYANRDYDAPQQVINIQRKNKEYDLGLSFWKRDFTLFKLTPRLSWNYHKVTSNSALQEYSKNNVNLEFTQTF